MTDLTGCFPRTLALLPEQVAAVDLPGADFPDWLAGQVAIKATIPPWLPELAILEEVLQQVTAQDESCLAGEVAAISINPTLQIKQCHWLHLPQLLRADAGITPGDIVPGLVMVLVWRQAISGRVICRQATDLDLLALKLVGEERDLVVTARRYQVAVGQLDLALEHGEDHGLLLVPPSRLRRDPAIFKSSEIVDEKYLSTPAFTLQWHITQDCDLHCKHCYDRSARKSVAFEQALSILDDFRSFCKERHVFGQVSFTGGNPLLYPRFFELYEAAAQRGLRTAILGNPAKKEVVARLQAIQPLAFYQVSLEGLEEHNNEIRGGGHFQRIVTFLEILRELQVFSMVMLTLTRANQEQVLPLAELLRDKVDYFTFNRLAMVGEGAALTSAPVSGFVDFLRDFRQAASHNPSMGLKDNFFNLQAREVGLPVGGGCTGYGCGAAFNFVSLLPEGEVHACRKFPSPIGNILENSWAEIYDSPQAQQYRQGPGQCQDCAIRPVCGGCLAVSHGFGQDVFAQRDPYCFLVSA